MIIVISTGEALSAGGDFGIGGWTPVLALVEVGDRILQQVIDFTGGSGVKPATGLYVGEAGLVADPDDATNVRGETGVGSPGLNAWTAIEAIVVDGERRVKQVVDWVGGTGDKPAIGMYVGPAGYVALAAQATDVRGAQGATLENSDSLAEGYQNRYFTDDRVRDVDLSGLDFSDSSPLLAEDTIVGALGKLQSQLNLRPKILGPIATGLRQPLFFTTGSNKAYESRLKVAFCKTLPAGSLLEFMLPTYAVANLTSPSRIADTDNVDPLYFEVAVEQSFVSANAGLNPNVRLQAFAVDGSKFAVYDPVVGPFPSCKMYVVVTQDIPAFSFIGAWTYIESLKASAPYTIPMSKQIDNTLEQRFEYSKAFAVANRGNIFNAATFTLIPGVADAYYPVSINAYVYETGEEIPAIFADSIPEAVYDQSAAGSNTTGGCMRGDKWGNAGILDKLIGTRMGKASLNLSKGSNSWIRENPATWIAAGLPAYNRRRLQVAKECNINTVYTNLGTNDAASPTNFATVKANYLAAVANWKSALPNLRVGLCTLLPKVDNVGDFAKTKTQVAVLLQATFAGFGSFRYLWNRFVMRPDITAMHDFGIELCAAIENDPVAMDNRIVSMDGVTTYPYFKEGTHPNFTGSSLIAETAEIGGRPTRNNSKSGVYAKFLQANLNSTGDQRIYMPPDVPSYRIKRIYVTNASVSLSNAVGGIYTAAAKGGTAIVAAGQTYNALVASDDYLELTVTNQNKILSVGSLYFSLTTAQGVAATADIYVELDDAT